MAYHYPVVVDSTNLKLKELPAGDVLDLSDATIETKDIVLQGALKQSKTAIAANGSCNLSTGTFFTKILNSSLSITFDNPPSANQVTTFSLEITANGAYSISWPGTVTWDAGVTPSIDTDGVNLFTFYTSDGGTAYRGSLVYTSTAI